MILEEYQRVTHCWRSSKGLRYLTYAKFICHSKNEQGEELNVDLVTKRYHGVGIVLETKFLLQSTTYDDQL